MTDVDDDLDDLDYVDALDCPACPRCGSSLYEHDREFRAWTCNECGLWTDDEDDVFIG